MLVLIALAVGGIIPIQTAANSRLRYSVGNRPILPALISFSTALACATLATVLFKGNPLPQFAPEGHATWWVWLGGFFGVCFVIGNIVLFPKLGAVQTVVLPILGQVVMGLATDQFGLFNSPQLEVTLPRVLGALVVLAGIAFVLVTSRGGVSGGTADGPEVWLYRLLGVAIGAGSAAQTAVNGYLGTIAGSSLHASVINLFVGSLLLLIAAAITSPKQLVTRPTSGPWWMWLGGVVGAIYVAAGATISPRIGTATTVIAFNAGTIVGGQIMESFGAFGAKKNPLTLPRIIGLALIFAGVLMVRLL